MILIKNKIYCYTCNKIVNAIIKNQNNSYTVRNKKININENILICPVCHSELYDDTLNDNLYDIYNEYLKTYNLSFEKLKKIRNYYNLSQELFAKALGWAKRTIVRYENAESLPQVKNLLIYKQIESNKNEFINILKSNKLLIEKETYFKIYNLINAELDLKTINTFLYILKDNYLTKTQIMKNLFSVDFQSYKERKVPITSLNYAHGTYGPIIDNKEAYLSLLIKQNYLEMVNDEEDNILFKPAQECNTSLFKEDEIAIMDEVLKTLKGKSASKLTTWSHKFKGWLDTKEGQKIKFDYSKYFELNKNW